MAWCRPPAMLAPCPAAPDHIARAAASVAPATSAEASCIPGKTGSSGVPSPYCSRKRRSAASPALARRTAPMYAGSCTSSISAVVAGSGTATVTPAAFSTPKSRASSTVSSTRTGASGCPGPKSYRVSRSSQATCRVQVTRGLLSRSASWRDTRWCGHAHCCAMAACRATAGHPARERRTRAAGRCGRVRAGIARYEQSPGCRGGPNAREGPAKEDGHGRSGAGVVRR